MWSKTRKALYERMAPSLKGKVKYDLKYCRSKYHTEPKANPRCHCIFCSYNRYFAIVVDKEKIIIANNQIYTGKYPATIEEKGRMGMFEMHDVGEAMHLYLNVCGIDECLQSENALLRLFAILDRRVGKRRIKGVYEQMEQEPEWLRTFIQLRAESEGIRSPEEKSVGR